MVRLVPVVERAVVDCPSWPVGGDGSHLVVPRDPGPGRVGALVWAREVVPGRADRLVAHVDRRPAIGPPL